MIELPLEVEVQLESVALKDPTFLLVRLVKWDLLQHVVELEHVVKKLAKETLVVLVNKDLYPQVSTGPRGVQGAKGLRGVAGIQGPLGVQGSTGGHGERGLKVDKGIQGSVGAKGDRGERSERSVKGEKGIQGNNSNVLNVLADHLPIQLATRYGEKMCPVKYIRGYVEYHRIVWRGGNAT